MTLKVKKKIMRTLATESRLGFSPCVTFKQSSIISLCINQSNLPAEHPAILNEKLHQT